MEKDLISTQRNKIAHAYLPEEIRDIYDEIFASSKKIFAAIERIKKYLADRKKREETT